MSLPNALTHVRCSVAAACAVRKTDTREWWDGAAVSQCGSKYGVELIWMSVPITHAEDPS